MNKLMLRSGNLHIDMQALGILVTMTLRVRAQLEIHAFIFCSSIKIRMVEHAVSAVLKQIGI